MNARAELLAGRSRSVREQRALAGAGYLRRFQPREARDEAEHLTEVTVGRASAARAYTLTYADLTDTERLRFDRLFAVHDPDLHAADFDLVAHLLRVVRARCH